MKPGPIIFAASTLALVAVLAPYLPTDAPAAVGGTTGATADDSRSRSAHEAWLGGGTVLERQADGHFYADAAVASHTARFLVDTGASMVALTGEDAAAMGLIWDDSDIVTIGHGASGEVRGVPVRLERIELGGLAADNVEAAIVPDGLGISLLGQSFLSRLDSVTIEGDRMVLGAE